MSVYPPQISEIIENTQKAGKLSEVNACGISATFVCGAALKVYLRIDEAEKKIVDAKYQTNACGYAVAAAEILAQEIIGKNLAELHGLNRGEWREKISVKVGEFGKERGHCLELVFDALRKTFAEFRASQISEFTGGEALICTCFGVTEERVESLVGEKSLTKVEEVSALCNAGSGCGSCQFLIREIIDSYWREQF